MEAYLTIYGDVMAYDAYTKIFKLKVFSDNGCWEGVELKDVKMNHSTTLLQALAKYPQRVKVIVKLVELRQHSDLESFRAVVGEDIYEVSLA